MAGCSSCWGPTCHGSARSSTAPSHIQEDKSTLARRMTGQNLQASVKTHLRRRSPTSLLHTGFGLRQHRVQAMKLAVNRHLANGFYPLVFQVEGTEW
jgi:hypothetical protein